MPWRDSHIVPLTRIDIVSQVPSESAVYAIADKEIYLLVGEAWNLKARLLELMNMLQDIGEFQVTYELCSEEERPARRQILANTLLRNPAPTEIRARELPGISFWNSAATRGVGE